MHPSQTAFTLGHSPDPDDAFMFYAMAENKIDLRGYRFEHRLEDIQTLNERALRGELHISAISIHAYAYVSDKYALLPCGASMGDGYGPILVRNIPHAMQHDLLEIIRESIEFGLAHRDEAVRHSLPYARDMDANLADKFIGMYVNEFTRDFGETGRAAIHNFLGDAHAEGYIDVPI